MTDERSTPPEGPTRSGPQRPAYHFTAPANWLNDPNGLCQVDGTYHLFYQYSPNDAHGHEAKHWGHATSADLLHWTDRRVALAPGDGADRGGCWSGSVVLDGDLATALYTGYDDGTQRQLIATSSGPDLFDWEKSPDNPVVATPPAGVPPGEFRDPYGRRADGAWDVFVGATHEDHGPVVLRYRASDLRDWEYVGIAARADERDPGATWECPALVPVDGADVLLASFTDTWSTEYRVGELGVPGDGFAVDEAGVLDYGDLYAPQAFLDEAGRPVLFGWIPEARPAEQVAEAGWSGAISLPRRLSLGPAGRLRVAPAREVRDLRADRHAVGSLVLTDEQRPLDVSGDRLELATRVAVDDATEAGLVVRRSADDAERTRVVLDADDAALLVDRSQSMASGRVVYDSFFDPDREQRMPVDTDEPVDLRVFVDRSVLEIYASGRCLTSRVYPDPDSLGVGAFANGGSAEFRSFEAWTMAPVWSSA